MRFAHSKRAIELVGDIQNPRLITSNTKINHTESIQNWIERRLKQLEKEKLCGFIFKSKSPSCGIGNIDVFDEQGKLAGKTSGIFAKAFMKKFTQIPIEDEVRLNNKELREKFIENIFIHQRLIRKNQT